MSAIFKIKEGYKQYTDVEKEIANYIIDNHHKVKSSSVHVLAQDINVSSASITRFAKKLGYKGFPELKIDLASQKEETEINYAQAILEKDDLPTLCEKTRLAAMQCLDNTYKLLNLDYLQEAINACHDCRNLYIFAVGNNGVVALDLQIKLSRLGKNVIFYSDTHIQVSASAHVSSEDAVIAISYNGETVEVNNALKNAKAQGAKTIAITKYHNSTLAKLADCVLSLPVNEQAIRIGAIQSRDASLAITDLIYLGVAHLNLDKTKEALVKTKRLTDKRFK